MAFFDRVRDSLTITGQGVTQKAKTAAETMKLNTQIKGNERAIEKIIYQIGLQCVSHHIDEMDTEYEEMFQEIRRLREENGDLQKQIEYVNASKICPYCGYHNQTTSKFCSGCGNSLETVPRQVIYCPECGAENEEDSRFCINCGFRLQQDISDDIPENPDWAEPAVEKTEEFRENRISHEEFVSEETNDRTEVGSDEGNPTPEIRETGTDGTNTVEETEAEEIKPEEITEA